MDRHFPGLFSFYFIQPAIAGAALETGHIDTFIVPFNEQVTSAPFAPLVFNNV